MKSRPPRVDYRRQEEFTSQDIAFLDTTRWIYGTGEEAISPVAPALANAVFQVTGKRIRSLPLKDHDLS